MARPSLLDTHPQRKQIIKALLDGEPVRKIAAWTNPPVSFFVIQRYKTSSVKPAIARSGSRLRNLDRAKNQHVTPDSATTQQIAQQAVQDAPVLELRDARIRLLQGLVDRLNIVMSERGEELSACGRCGKERNEHPWQDAEDSTRKCAEFVTVAGGKSGLVVRDFRGSGSTMRPVYKVDGVVLSEARELSKQIAQELGQWVEKSDVKVQAEVSSVSVVLSQHCTLEQLEAMRQAGLKQLQAPVEVKAEPVDATASPAGDDKA